LDSIQISLTSPSLHNQVNELSGLPIFGESLNTPFLLVILDETLGSAGSPRRIKQRKNRLQKRNKG